MRHCFALLVPFVLWACASSNRPVERAATMQRAAPIVGEVRTQSINVSDADAHPDAIVEDPMPLWIFWFFGDRPVP